MQTTTLARLTDDELVNAYATGNNEAFDTLLLRHQNVLMGYIMRLVRDRDLANDIFQETFIKAITTIRQGRYNPDGKFGAWINRIAHNLVIDSYRQDRVENTVSSDNPDSDLLNRVDLSDGTIEDALVDGQIRTDVRRLVMELPENQREVLVMRFYREMSFKEIAAATGVSINTALGRARYALINLRKLAADRHIALTA